MCDTNTFPFFERFVANSHIFNQKNKCMDTNSEDTKIHEVGRFWSTSQLSEKMLYRLHQIHTWFSDERMAKFISLIRQTDELSLRALDWLVTNYAKKNYIVLADEKNIRPPINVYSEYRTMLSFWHQKMFDPFRRSQRIYFLWTLPDGKQNKEETTVAQLNFLHWAECRGILQYARTHINELNADMNAQMIIQKEIRQKYKELGIKHKRRELSKAPKRKCLVYKINSQINLNPELLKVKDSS